MPRIQSEAAVVQTDLVHNCGHHAHLVSHRLTSRRVVCKKCGSCLLTAVLTGELLFIRVFYT